jgi:hypothetical protein
MWDHCKTFPPFIPTSEYEKPTIRSCSSKAPSRMAPRFTVIVNTTGGTMS